MWYKVLCIYLQRVLNWSRFPCFAAKYSLWTSPHGTVTSGSLWVEHEAMSHNYGRRKPFFNTIFTIPASCSCTSISWISHDLRQETFGQFPSYIHSAIQQRSRMFAFPGNLFHFKHFSWTRSHLKCFETSFLFVERWFIWSYQLGCLVTIHCL